MKREQADAYSLVLCTFALVNKVQPVSRDENLELKAVAVKCWKQVAYDCAKDDGERVEVARNSAGSEDDRHNGKS